MPNTHRAHPASLRAVDHTTGVVLARAGLIAAVVALCQVGIPTSAGAQAARPKGQAASDSAALVAQARTLMEGYGRDLRTGSRARLASWYDRTGAYRVGSGTTAFETHAQVAASYAGAEWQPPASFAWRDLVYEVLGPHAVLVVGGFDWSMAPSQRPMHFSYSAVLRRRPEGLRIRLEDYSADPRAFAPPPTAPTRRDTARP